jgi:hypothetical protein
LIFLQVKVLTKIRLTACHTFGQIARRWVETSVKPESEAIVLFWHLWIKVLSLGCPHCAMVFPLLQHEWWFCQDPDCSSSDRVYGLQAQSLAHLWLQQLKDDSVRMHILRDLVRNNISLPLFRVGDDSLARRIEDLLISGRLHLHKEEREVHSGWGGQEKQVPFPLSDRQPRDTAPPPPVIDPPSFSSKVNLSAQAAVLVAAAASGTPFCLE